MGHIYFKMSMLRYCNVTMLFILTYSDGTTFFILRWDYAYIAFIHK